MAVISGDLVQCLKQVFSNINQQCHLLDLARPKIPFELSPEQRAELRRLIQAPNTPQKLVRRARIGLLAAEGKDNKEIADALGTSHVVVGLWRQRILAMGLAGL